MCIIWRFQSAILFPSLQVVYELPATSQWIFECQWCPRNPSVISTASFDGHVTMYSLLGGAGGGASAEPAADEGAAVPSSGGDFFDDVKVSVAARSRAVETTPLKTPPKWFRRPCGASFAVSVQVKGQESKVRVYRVGSATCQISHMAVLSRVAVLDKGYCSLFIFNHMHTMAARVSSYSRETVPWLRLNGHGT